MPTRRLFGVTRTNSAYHLPAVPFVLFVVDRAPPERAVVTVAVLSMLERVTLADLSNELHASRVAGTKSGVVIDVDEPILNSTVSLFDVPATVSCHSI